MVVKIGDTEEMSGAGSEQHLQVGYVPLADCAPLVIAHELGFYRDEGLDVTLSAEPSWANIRDKIQLGQLDAAQMLAPMPLAASLGIDGRATPTLSTCTLNLNGNGITVAHSIYERMCELAPDALTPPISADALAVVIADRRARGEPPLRLAAVYPFSTHAYHLRYWLASAGIDPDRDVNLRAVPPPLMATQLEAAWIDGYCVGEPWNSVAVAKGLGHTLITSHELWNNGQEKVLAVTAAWAERNPHTLRALLRAVLRAGRWLDEPGHRASAAQLLSEHGYVDTPTAILNAGLTGAFSYGSGHSSAPNDDFMVFHRYAANFPWHSHMLWYATQMARWGHIPDTTDLPGIVCDVVRPDLYRQAADDLALPYPSDDMKIEGEHDTAWTLETERGAIIMGPDTFFDGTRFDPHQIEDYLATLPLTGVRATPTDRRQTTSADGFACKGSRAHEPPK